MLYTRVKEVVTDLSYSPIFTGNPFIEWNFRTQWSQLKAVYTLKHTGNRLECAARTNWCGLCYNWLAVSPAHRLSVSLTLALIDRELKRCSHNAIGRLCQFHAFIWLTWTVYGPMSLLSPSQKGWMPLVGTEILLNAKLFLCQPVNNINFRV